MKYFDWNEDKNKQLIRERGISFEIIVSQIESGKLLDVMEHTNVKKYTNQFFFIID